MPIGPGQSPGRAVRVESIEHLNISTPSQSLDEIRRRCRDIRRQSRHFWLGKTKKTLENFRFSKPKMSTFSSNISTTTTNFVKGLRWPGDIQVLYRFQPDRLVGASHGWKKTQRPWALNPLRGRARSARPELGLIIVCSKISIQNTLIIIQQLYFVSIRLL